jgi:hypothetical protein
MLGTFISINASDTEQMLSYTSDFMTDMTPLLIPIIAVGVGIFIFWAIVHSIKK